MTLTATGPTTQATDTRDTRFAPHHPGRQREVIDDVGTPLDSILRARGSACGARALPHRRGDAMMSERIEYETVKAALGSSHGIHTREGFAAAKAMQARIEELEGEQDADRAFYNRAAEKDLEEWTAIRAGLEARIKELEGKCDRFEKLYEGYKAGGQDAVAELNARDEV